MKERTSIKQKILTRPVLITSGDTKVEYSSEDVTRISIGIIITLMRVKVKERTVVVVDTKLESPGSV
jgi:hypothetical protein